MRGLSSGDLKELEGSVFSILFLFLATCIDRKMKLPHGLRGGFGLKCWFSFSGALNFIKPFGIWGALPEGLVNAGYTGS